MRVIPLLVLAACAAPAADVGDDAAPSDDKGDRPSGAPRFTEVNGRHTTKTFRAYVERALDVLAADHSQLAQLTLASIEAGRVKIDELADLTCEDLAHAKQDVPGLTPQNAADELDGYMWSNRIYVARGLTAKRLASTLIHETNHVVNHSEQGYYDDLPTSAFVEEYRAFYLEAQFDPDEWAGVDLVDYVIDNYELDRAKIHASVLAHPLSPQLLPTAAAWKARHVEGDVATPCASR